MKTRMSTVELVEQAIAAAKSLGYRVRHDWLDGVTSGPCLINGQKWLFLDLGDSPTEQLALLRDALAGEPDLETVDLQPELAEQFPLRRSA